MYPFDDVVAKLRTLAETVFAAAPARGGTLRACPVWKFASRSDGVMESHLEEEIRIDWPRVNIREWISTFPLFNDIADILWRSEHFKAWVSSRVSGGTPDSARMAGLRLFTEQFLSDVIDDRAWSISEEYWKTAVKELKLLLIDGLVTHRTRAFLHGLGLAHSVDLDGLSLRMPTHEELLVAFNRGQFEGPDSAAMSCRALIEASEVAPLDSHPVIGQRIAALLNALQIWTKRPISPFVTFQHTGTVKRAGQLRPAARFFNCISNPPILANPDDFKLFWSRSRDVLLRPPNELGVALRRLDVMINQERQADRILDLCIILEALFQRKEDENMELAYRLSMRTAHFVGECRASRNSIFDAVRAGYKLRSNIAHGNVTSQDISVQEKLETVVFDALRGYCQRAAAFSNESAHKNIIREIDGYLLERRGDPP